MPVYQQGSLNTAGLTTDDIYVVIVPPQTSAVQGIATNVGGFVGAATWGPVNTPVVIGTPSDAKNAFGPIGLGQYDLVTDLILAMRQGAANNRGVRVTDGTDVAASAILSDGTNAIATDKAYYTGTQGSTLTRAIALGSNNTNPTTPTSYKVTFSRPGFSSEVFDNLPATGFQAAYVSAINNGQSGLRGPSALIKSSLPTVVAPIITGAMFTPSATGGTLATGVFRAVLTYVNAQGETSVSNEVTFTTTTNAASCAFAFGTAFATGLTGKLYITAVGGAAGTETFSIAVTNAGNATITAAPGAGAASPPGVNLATILNALPPTIGTTTLAGGTDGATGVNSAIQLGADGNTRTGMYALRGTGVQHFCLCGNVDTSTWSTQQAFALSEGANAAACFPTGTSTTAALALVTTLGVRDWHFKPFKDFISFFDSENNLVRSVSPASTWIGARCNLSPEQSTSNKQVLGLIGTERTITGIPYSTAEIGQLEGAGVSLISNPIPMGPVLGFRHGQNSSADPTTSSETYTTMTNFLAYSCNASLGKWVGKVQGSRVDDPTRRGAEASVQNFLEGLRTPTVPGQLGMIDSYSTDFQTGNTPVSIGQGYLFGSAKVRYLGIVRWFVFSLEGGALTTTVSASSPK